MASFRSKYDAWLVLAAASVVPTGLYAVVSVWPSGSWALRAFISVLMAGSTLLVVWGLWGTRYEVGITTLRIQSGVLRWSVPIASIRSVEPTRDITSGPAWSLDRLRITATEQTLLISPLDKQGFVDALLKNDAGLRRDGERVVRA